MLKDLIAYLAGSVEFEILGGQGERFLNVCAKSEIPIQHIAPTPLGFTAQVPVRDYRKLHRLAHQYRCRLRMTGKRGACFALWVYRKRWGLVAGAALAATVLFLCTRMIWSVCFYNVTSQEEILLRKQLYEKNICEGSIVSRMDLKTAQSELFVQNNGYGWVKLNFVYGRLIVEKSNAVQRPVPAVQEDATDIVALCDGRIESIKASGGAVRCVKGQYVAQGDLLVGGMWYGPRATLYQTNAQAKVYAAVEQIYEVRQPLHVTQTVPQAKEESFYAIHFAGSRVPLYREIQASPQSTQSVVKYPLTIFGLPLPATIEETRVRDVREISYLLTQEQAKEIARARALDTMRIALPELKIATHSETFEMDGDILVLRMKMQGTANIARTVPADSARLPAPPPQP